jgi:hypothetical protein
MVEQDNSHQGEEALLAFAQSLDNSVRAATDITDEMRDKFEIHEAKESQYPGRVNSPKSGTLSKVDDTGNRVERVDQIR